MSRVVWVLEVRYDDDDSATYGPYTERQAERLAALIIAEVQTFTPDSGISEHPRSVLGAIAHPLRRYGDLLDTPLGRGSVGV